jgi:GNAT superfamily N-acetyltransferase
MTNPTQPRRSTSAVWTLRSAQLSDATWIAELRAVVMRPDLERLGRWDSVRVRQRFLDAFRPAHTHVIQVDGEPVGVIAIRAETDEQWIEHFYISPNHQGKGIGRGVLQNVMERFADTRPFRIDVMQGSAARRLYERAGFVFESEDAIDVCLVAPGTPTLESESLIP